MTSKECLAFLCALTYIVSGIYGFEDKDPWKLLDKKKMMILFRGVNPEYSPVRMI